MIFKGYITERTQWRNKRQGKYSLQNIPLSWRLDVNKPSQGKGRNIITTDSLVYDVLIKTDAQVILSVV